MDSLVENESTNLMTFSFLTYFNISISEATNFYNLGISFIWAFSITFMAMI